VTLPWTNARFDQNAAHVVTGGGGGGDSAAYTNFIARTSGLDGTHTTAYQTLLNGLTSDGIFNSDGTSTYLDALYVFATADSTTANLNLCSASYPCVHHAGILGSATFTADAGWTGIDSNSSVVGTGPWLDTGLDLTTGGLKFTTNAAHMMVWNNSNRTVTDVQAYSSIGQAGTAAGDSGIIPNYTDNKSYFRINDVHTGNSAGVAALTDRRGFYAAVRHSSSVQKGFVGQGGSGSTPGSITDMSVTSVTSEAVTSGNVYILSQNTIISGVSSAQGGEGNQIMAASIGGDIYSAGNTTLTTAFYDRLYAYLHTIAGISY
jgi:hypothetical protein